MKSELFEDSFYEWLQVNGCELISHTQEPMTATDTARNLTVHYNELKAGIEHLLSHRGAEDMIELGKFRRHTRENRQMLEDALHAMRHGRSYVAEEFLDRTIEVMNKDLA